MSPRFYTYLWVVYAVAALLFWVVGSLTLFVGVVFGFIAFGLIFAGMMCVLPAQVAHEHEKPERVIVERPTPIEVEAKPDKVAAIGALRSV